MGLPARGSPLNGVHWVGVGPRDASRQLGPDQGQDVGIDARYSASSDGSPLGPGRSLRTWYLA